MLHAGQAQSDCERTGGASKKARIEGRRRVAHREIGVRILAPGQPLLTSHQAVACLALAADVTISTGGPISPIHTFAGSSATSLALAVAVGVVIISKFVVCHSVKDAIVALDLCGMQAWEEHFKNAGNWRFKTGLKRAGLDAINK